MKWLLFSEQMVKAWMEGRKTVTRRLMNPQPGPEVTEVLHAHDSLCLAYIKQKYGQESEHRAKYTPGETVYIKEAWGISASFPVSYQKDEFVVKGGNHLWYKADHPATDIAIIWKSPRFMPEWASRSHARIVSVRPERVQEITESEAIKEGTPHILPIDVSRMPYPCSMIQGQFAALWESIHTGSWDRNDWVWRIELEKLP